MGNNDQEKAKPRRASLPKELKTDNLTLEEALVLLSLPRLLGVHPDGGVIEADRGRFGPYIKWIKNEDESENRSLKKEDDVFKVDLKRALEILAMPKLGRGGQEIIKDFGKPEELDDKIQILNGRYGLYVKCGKINASLPKDTDLEKFTLDKAVTLLGEKMKDKKGPSFKRNKVTKKKNLKDKKIKK